MKVLITGANGQVGWELQRSAPNGAELLPLGSRELDVSDAASVDATIGEFQPDLIINAAAYTAVDRAEADREAAYAVNAEGAGNLARAAQARGARLIHISTDFVFDGEKATPYQPDDAVAPLGVYGASKQAGDEQVLDSGVDALIIRTAWVYSSHGNNFVKTMLRLMAERDELGIVADQIGTPTWAHGLALAIWAAAEKPGLAGIYHWTDAGVASWYDFAVAIYEEATALGLLQKSLSITPIPASAYPTPARRPACAVLDKSKSWSDLQINPVHWRAQLRSVLTELSQAED